ncbi:hypothetical protein AYO40_04415 [Planctomycetaceae bacterium SCGC AG-212-D15]|nr:hypothetical protein AYO40_04415 [Planctomycetaceae bacterium SCGC AG-212-D15]
MATDRPKRRDKRPHPLPRHGDDKRVSAPRQLGRQQIISQMTDLIAGCREQLERHGAGCDCETCCVVSNFVGALRLFRLVLEIS